MQPNVDFHSFQSREKLLETLTATIAEYLEQGITTNGHASLAVSGGSTPIELFKKLSTYSIPWQHVFICLVDERWVEADDADSNEKLVRTYLLQNKAAVANFTGMKNAALTASDGMQECKKDLEKIPQPFDVVILGLGGDGHTASLFPGAQKLTEATNMLSSTICMGIAPLTAPHERMTLTLPAILNSRQMILHITGQEKKNVLENAQKDGPLEEFPIRFILSQNSTPFSIYWAE
jgi:6-phosphogluconolactonase